MSSSVQNAAIQESHVTARRWLDALPCAAFIVDPEGRIAVANGEAELILGWPAPDLEGLSTKEIFPSEDDPAGGRLMAQSLIGDAVPERGQRLIRCADDALRPIEYSCIPFPVEQGLGAIFGFRELTRERELENDLRRLASIADESPIPIIELNQDANLMYANPAMMALIERFGFSTEARPLVLPANILKLTRQCLETRLETGAIEVSIGDNHYEWKLFPVSGANLVRGYGMDATARRRALIELTIAKATTEVASQAKSKILSSVKDELHDPLQAIARAADSLLDGTLTGEQLDAVKSIHSACSALMKSVEELLSAAVLHAGHRRSEAAPFNLRAFIARVLSPFIRRASEKELQLTLTISNHVPGEITSDASRLEQLFRIILRTVMDAAKGGEISIEIDRDSIAIPHSLDGAPQYFQLFINVAYRVPGTTANGNGIPRASSGTPFAESPLDGPALAVECRELADLLGGTVRVEQDVSGGSFCFSLPIRCSKSATVRLAGGNNRLAVI